MKEIRSRAKRQREIRVGVGGGARSTNASLRGLETEEGLLVRLHG